MGRLGHAILVFPLAFSFWILVESRVAEARPPKTGLTPTLTSTRRVELTDAQLSGLLANLDAGRLHEVPAAWFGNSYDPTLPDLIFYVPGRNQPIVQLVQDGETKQRLFGARYIWVIVFVAGEALRPPAEPAPLQSVRHRHASAAVVVDSTWGSSSKKAEQKAVLRFEPLDYRLGLGDITVLKGLALLSKVPLAEPEGLKDESADIKLEKIGTRDGRDLFYAPYKFQLRENSVNRVRLSLGDTLRTYTTFGNYSRSRTGLSFALVAGWPGRSSAKPRNVDLQPYLPIHWYFNRPERPRLPDQGHLAPRQRTVAHSLFVAPTVSDHPFDGFMVGYSAAYWLGRVGVVAGPEFRKGDRTGTTLWRTRWSIGLNVGL